MDTAELERIVGVENVVAGAAAGEYAVNGVLPEAVVAPGTREEAAAVIRLAAERRWSLVPYGGGTQMPLGRRASQLDLVLSTRRMDQVVDYQPDDMTITVEPGVTMAEVAATLATRGQFLPLDPPEAVRATVGGTVASAAFGPWCAGHGTPRDWVIGCRVVGIDGKEVRAGGLVVKNVAGYDLPKLYTGSFGTLGLITEVTFKVMPVPGITGYTTVACDTPEQAEQLIAGIRNSDLLPSVVELLGPVPVEDGGPWRLFIQFLHVPEAVDWQIDYLTSLAERLGARPQRLAESAGAQLLAALRETPHSLPFVARIGTVSSKVTEIAAHAAAIIQRSGRTPLVQAHAVHGRVYALAPDGDRALAEELRKLARSSGANCLFPRLPEELVGDLDPWGEVGPERRLLEGIKRALDPQGVFSPGRFVGGL